MPDDETVIDYTYPPAEFMHGRGTSKTSWEVIRSYMALKESGSLPGRVLVIGSGDNTELWKSKGAVTLDIDPSVNPDIVGDANELQKIVEESGKGPFDVVVSEFLLMYRDKGGVSLNNLLKESYKILKPGGVLFIEGASVDESKVAEGVLPTSLASPKDTMDLMDKFGYSDVAYYRGEMLVRLENVHEVGDEKVGDYYTDNHAVFYGVKPRVSS